MLCVYLEFFWGIRVLGRGNNNGKVLGRNVFSVLGVVRKFVCVGWSE